MQLPLVVADSGAAVAFGVAAAVTVAAVLTFAFAVAALIKAIIDKPTVDICTTTEANLAVSSHF